LVADAPAPNPPGATLKFGMTSVGGGVFCGSGLPVRTYCTLVRRKRCVTERQRTRIIWLRKPSKVVPRAKVGRRARECEGPWWGGEEVDGVVVRRGPIICDGAISKREGLARREGGAVGGLHDGGGSGARR
jgi:hypothetical protein